MKRHIALFFFLFALSAYCLLPAVSFAADKNPTPYDVRKLIGKQAPDFTLRDIDGRQVRLSDQKGRPVLLFFWASWCPTASEEFRSMNKLYSMYKDRGLVVLAVSSDRTVEAEKAFVSANPATFTILHDEDFRVSKSLYKAFMIPMTFVINRNGVIVRKHFGEQDWTRPAILKEIESLL